MRATWLTDLHLNFLDKWSLSFFYEKVAKEKPDVLLITGDTGEAHNVFRFLEELKETSGAKEVYYVLGNHDYYGSSIKSVRQKAKSFCTWLQHEDPINLTEDICLIGVDGWGDGTVGNWENSSVSMADWQHIEDLMEFRSWPGASVELVDKLRKLGSAEARQLLVNLNKALTLKPKRIVVLTHVPPFPEACWYKERQSDPDFLPWFTCTRTGEVLRKIAGDNPATDFFVLCGHTHGRGEFNPLSNLKVLTGGWPIGVQDYGNPTVQQTFEC